jgi:photosystem II stability/assembly factor-like uncharacterized protein
MTDHDMAGSDLPWEQPFTFTDIFFLDSDHGWFTAGGFAGPGALFATSDGGESWRNILFAQDLAENYRFYAVYFIDVLNGWICGEYGEDGDGVLWRTKDGGLSWEIITAQTLGAGLPANSGAYTQVVFLDHEHGFLISSGEHFLESFDGGKTWVRAQQLRGQAYGLYFLDDDPRIGWVLCQEVNPATWASNWTGHWFTADAGGHWSDNADHFDGVVGVDIAACRFWNQLEGIICGPDGVLFRTHDGGKHWHRLRPPISGDLNFLFLSPFAQDRSVWMVGAHGGIWLSDNGGLHWETRQSGTLEELHAIWFNTAQRGWVIGAGGILLGSMDGGQTWHSQTIAPTEIVQAVVRSFQ